ncbi:hypothetical protein DFH06DRAFT_355192 [Mycena polygramma]|nr:hypothetical protein DFH06DRAFT_355192 [Mycena polygramma]
MKHADGKIWGWCPENVYKERRHLVITCASAAIKRWGSVDTFPTECAVDLAHCKWQEGGLEVHVGNEMHRKQFPVSIGHSNLSCELKHPDSHCTLGEIMRSTQPPTLRIECDSHTIEFEGYTDSSSDMRKYYALTFAKKTLELVAHRSSHCASFWPTWLIIYDNGIVGILEYTRKTETDTHGRSKDTVVGGSMRVLPAEDGSVDTEVLLCMLAVAAFFPMPTLPSTDL